MFIQVVKRNNRGFSLIELIIVIAIMAVLVAVIAPNLTKYLGSSKKAVDERNLDEIHQQALNCIADAVTGDPAVDVIVGEDGIKVAEYEVKYNASTGVTAITANANANSGFASMLSVYLKDATTKSKVDKNKTVIKFTIKGDVINGYQVSEKFDTP